MENLSTALVAKAPTHDSPLRYPGGKSSLTESLGKCIAAMGVDKVTYVEPYAGGAGAGISLLMRGQITQVVINDLDPAVHSFWRGVVEQGPRFAERIAKVPLTLYEWERQREIYKLRDTEDWFNLGFAFFYLNRTNRSGVLNGGVIGGKAQSGTYRIDSRYNPRKLAERVMAISDRNAQIAVLCEDGVEVIETYANRTGVFQYIDPPYVKMGNSLYWNAFDEDMHRKLADSLVRYRDSWWALTYDDAPLIQQLYGTDGNFHVENYPLYWSANNRGRASELSILSDPLSAAFPDHRVSEPCFGGPR